jgi:hypothetical protein
MNAPADLATVIASQPDAALGYNTFTLGSFTFHRDEHFGIYPDLPKGFLGFEGISPCLGGMVSTVFAWQRVKGTVE